MSGRPATWWDSDGQSGARPSRSPDAEELAALDAAGLNQAEIGARLGVARTSVRLYFQKAGVVYQRKPSAGERRCQALTEAALRYWYWECGLSLRKTAAAVGVSYGSVLKRMQALGIPTRPR